MITMKSQPERSLSPLFLFLFSATNQSSPPNSLELGFCWRFSRCFFALLLSLDVCDINFSFDIAKHLRK